MSAPDATTRITFMLEDMTVEQLKRTVMVFIEKSDKYENLYNDLRARVQAVNPAPVAPQGVEL